MARKEVTIDQTTQRLADSKGDSVDPNQSTVRDTTNDSPTLSDGYDQIVEEAPGIGGATDMTPMGDPGDLSSFGTSSLLPDDLGIGDDPALGDPTNPGGDLGSGLLDDLTSGASDRSDPTDGFDGMSDGWDAPVIDDQSSAMDGGGSFPYGTGPPDIGQWDTVTTTTYGSPPGAVDTLTTWEPAVHGDDPEEGQSSHGTEQPGAGVAGVASDPWFENADEPDDSGGLQQDETWSPTSDQVRQEPADTDEDEEGREEQEGPEEQKNDHEPQTSNGPTQGSDDSTPIPPEVDDGTGGDPDIDDLIGGRGDIDPAPETEPAGAGGSLDTVAAGLGAVDPDPDAEEASAGTIDMVSLGQGVIDPLEGESTLLGDDAGDLADMSAQADLGDAEVEFDDSLVDADIGEDG